MIARPGMPDVIQQAHAQWEQPVRCPKAEHIRRARRVVATHALDAQDLRHLLRILGLHNPIDGGDE